MTYRGQAYLYAFLTLKLSRKIPGLLNIFFVWPAFVQPAEQFERPETIEPLATKITGNIKPFACQLIF